MITRKMEEKLDELKRYFNTKLTEQEENLTAVFNNLLNNFRKEISKEVKNEVNKQCKHIKFGNKFLKQ